MLRLEPLIADLALIFICAGVMMFLFKSLRQPVVLAYIAPSTTLIGLFICSPFLWMLLRIIITAVFVSYFVDYAIPWSS